MAGQFGLGVESWEARYRYQMINRIQPESDNIELARGRERLRKSHGRDCSAESGIALPLPYDLG